jgi:predicted metalloprotease
MGERQSGNIEDRRGLPVGGMALGGGGIIIALLALLFGFDPREILNQVNGGAEQTQVQPQAPSATDDEAKQFVSVVLAETEDVWRDQFQQLGKTYQDPTLVLFTDQVQSTCGLASAAVGPFYCPEDGKLYIDLTFFDMLDKRFGAPGDFAQAYVIAHEVGHHVQNLLGITSQVQEQRARMSAAEANALSVRLELQADFLAGVWAHHTQQMKQVIQDGDIEEALNAASAIGDDRLQMEGQGRVAPDAFTHGTSAQRARWFRLGYETGDIRKGDTFNADRL